MTFFVCKYVYPYANVCESVCMLEQGRQSWGAWVATPRFWAGGRGRVVKYYYILSCTGSRAYMYVRKWWLLKRNNNNLPRSSCKWPIFAWRFEFLREIAWKIESFRKFAWTNRNAFDPDPRPSDFKPDWGRCAWISVLVSVPLRLCVCVSVRVCVFCICVCPSVCLSVFLSFCLHIMTALFHGPYM